MAELLCKGGPVLLEMLEKTEGNTYMLHNQPQGGGVPASLLRKRRLGPKRDVGWIPFTPIRLAQPLGGLIEETSRGSKKEASPLKVQNQRAMHSRTFFRMNMTIIWSLARQRSRNLLVGAVYIICLEMGFR